MIDDTLFTENIAFRSEFKMLEICQPLFSNTLINYFNYVKLLDDKNHISLSTKIEWLKYFLKNNFYQETVFEKETHLSQKNFFLWDASNESQKIITAQRDLFQIDHGITIILPWSTGNEYFHFATDLNYPHVNNFYINHLDLLNKFIIYFKRRAKDLIKQATFQPIKRGS